MGACAACTDIVAPRTIPFSPAKFSVVPGNNLRKLHTKIFFNIDACINIVGIQFYILSTSTFVFRGHLSKASL